MVDDECVGIGGRDLSAYFRRNWNVRRGLRGLLEAAGIAVVAEASDGLEAIRLCEEERPDLMILDISMPKLSGIEVAARAAKFDAAPGVIILSVHCDESYIMRALAVGARAYL